MITGREAEIIVALADNSMNVSDTARNTYLHRNTVEYHIAKIRKKTGLNPKCFYDLCKLIQMVKRKDNKDENVTERD